MTQETAKTQTVWLVILNSTYNGEHETEIRTYGSLESAKQAFFRAVREEKALAKDEGYLDEDGNCTEEWDMDYCAIDGAYSWCLQKIGWPEYSNVWIDEQIVLK